MFETLALAVIAIGTFLGMMVSYEIHQFFLAVLCAVIYTASIFRIGFLTGYPNRR